MPSPLFQVPVYRTEVERFDLSLLLLAPLGLGAAHCPRLIPRGDEGAAFVGHPLARVLLVGGVDVVPVWVFVWCG